MTPEFPPPTPAPEAALPEPTSAAPATTPPPARKPGRGRLVALGTAAVLSAVVVGGGVGYGVLQTVDKPKHRVVAATKPAPAKPPTYGALSNGNHFGSLGDLLLPIPNGMTAGPDDAGFGNDAVLTTAQYKAFYDQTISYLSTADRKLMQQDFQASYIKGYAVRTYLVDNSMTVEVALRQENQNAAKADAKAGKDLADATGAFRPGPAVPGFPKTHCYLPPLVSGDKLDYMDCDASVGDMYVWLHVEGVAPLESSAAVTLLSQQLTRLAIPGAQT
ncbi:hypothetical protein [Streptacidiphilus cavernicola]|uniref:Uncharacterized protein n=1 Tax=Streptacidiphilus cavernicola TaxID=3342716 RepID=A0ABV6VW12_9ACTN